MDLKFKILKRNLLLESTRFKIESLDVEIPGGKIAHWEVDTSPNSFAGVPVENGFVYLTKEWRTGPEDFLTQFTIARWINDKPEESLNELKRELKEELGIINGKYSELVTHQHGTKITGKRVWMLITDFEIGETERDEDEFQEIIKLPIKGLFEELKKNHLVTAETLLIAKILEEKFL